MPKIDAVHVRAYRIPTETPESDGTLEWDATTLVVAFVLAGGRRGFGYTYAAHAAATLIADTLAGRIAGVDAMDVGRCWERMATAVRNYGRAGIAASAIAAVDIALWDLKARLLDLPLHALLGAARDDVPVYGSGGFTSYDAGQLESQLAGWAGQGLGAVKMKVGRDPDADRARVRLARQAIGPDVKLLVDANGAYQAKQALSFAEAFAAEGVTWFEEPVSSNDLSGLRLLRDRAPAGMEIAAGEYAYEAADFRRLLQAEAIDVMQADVTRCMGITGFLRAAAMCRGAEIPLSTHTAPTAHLAAALATPTVRHIEWFHDHVRIERMLFDGAPQPRAGRLAPDPARPGLGIEFKERDAETHAL